MIHVVFAATVAKEYTRSPVTRKIHPAYVISQFKVALRLIDATQRSILWRSHGSWLSANTNIENETDLIVQKTLLYTNSLWGYLFLMLSVCARVAQEGFIRPDGKSMNLFVATSTVILEMILILGSFLEFLN